MTSESMDEAEMKRLFFVVVLFWMNTSFGATHFFYCEKTNDYVYIGDTVDHVKALCGQPMKESTETIVPQITQKVLRYIYHFQPNSGLRLYKPNALVIDIVDDRVTMIQVEGQSVEETTYCGRSKLFKIGTKRQRVLYYCKWPHVRQAVIKKIDQPKVSQTVLVYQIDAYSPAVELYFHDGKLVEIKK